jgi:hypothetical protein
MFNFIIPEGFVLVLRTVKPDMSAYGGFMYPTSGRVWAEDWDETPLCGGGLHGWLWGEGDDSLAIGDEDTRLWLLLLVDEAKIVRLDGKVKFPEGEVVFCGDWQTAVKIIQRFAPDDTKVNRSTNSGGYGSTNSGGDRSTNSGGDRSTNSGGEGSTNSGGNGSTNSGGNGSTNSGGDRSTNSGGYGSTNSGGDGSTNSGGNGSTNSGGDRSTNSGGYGSTNSGGYGSTNSGGYGSTNSGGDGSTNSGGYGSTNSGGNGSTNSGGEGSTNSGGYGSTNSGGNRSTNSGGEGAVVIGERFAKCKSGLGGLLVFRHYCKKEGGLRLKFAEVDGVKIRENIFYTLSESLEIVEADDDN